MKLLIPSPRSSTRTAAFSLVEVVLAVGIMALGVVTILGLLPHGLEMSRKTANELAETRIADQLIAEMQAMDWALLNTNSDTISANNRFFDDQGLEIDTSNPDFSLLVSYVARVNVPDSDVHLLTNAATSQINNHLRRVTIKLVSAPLPDFDFDNPPPGFPVRSISQLIARTTGAPGA